MSRHSIHQSSGIARSTFYSKLANRPDDFTVRELGRIASALGVTLNDLTAGA